MCICGRIFHKQVQSGSLQLQRWQEKAHQSSPNPPLVWPWTASICNKNAANQLLQHDLMSGGWFQIDKNRGLTGQLDTDQFGGTIGPHIYQPPPLLGAQQGPVVGANGWPVDSVSVLLMHCLANEKAMVKWAGWAPVCQGQAPIKIDQVFTFRSLL